MFLLFLGFFFIGGGGGVCPPWSYISYCGLENESRFSSHKRSCKHANRFVLGVEAARFFVTTIMLFELLYVVFGDPTLFITLFITRDTSEWL